MGIERHPMNDVCPYCGGRMEPMFEERNVGPFGVLVGLKCSCCGTEGPKVWLNKRMLKTNEILWAITTEASFEGMFVPDEIPNDEEETR